MKKFLAFACLTVLLTACSTTSHLAEDEVLYAGLKEVVYAGDDEHSAHLAATKEEVDAALACAPNGAFFGSSYYRTPFPYGLWLWNALEGKDTKFANWMRKSFANEPVLMSWVNPNLRATVAENALRNNGYFNGKVDYEVVETKNPKEQKLAYKVDMGKLYLLDSLRYIGFSEAQDSLIGSSLNERVIRRDDPFSVTALEKERQRVSNLLRNNGYYYYQSGYATYLADTLFLPGRVLINLRAVDDMPEEARRPWYLGRMNINIMRTNREVLTESSKRRRFTINYAGKRSPIRTRVIMQGVKMRRGELFSYDKYEETMSVLNANGAFSSVDFSFAPRDTTALCDTLDMNLTCVLEKPYSFYLESGLRHRTTGKMGPELKIGVTRLNAFRGGEKLDFNLHSSLEWNLSGGSGLTYEAGGDVTLALPRLLLPGVKRRRWIYPPSTLLTASVNTQNRSGFFRRTSLSFQYTYAFQTSATVKHQFTPLKLDYQFMASRSDAFNQKLEENQVLATNMADNLIPRMQYTMSYQSPKSKANPFMAEVTVTEAGNVVSLAYLAGGRGWKERDKNLLRTPYSQFLSFHADMTKHWVFVAQEPTGGSCGLWIYIQLRKLYHITVHREVLCWWCKFVERLQRANHWTR